MKNKFSKFINLQGKYLTSLLILLTMGIGQMWGTAYTPTSDEVIILSAHVTSSSPYSDHSAISFAGTPSSKNDRKCGNPATGEATANNVTCYSVKGNGKGKNITVSITGCSKIIIYHENHSSRYVELREGNKTGTLIGKGSANTYYTEVSLTGSTSYNIFLHGTTGSDDQDFYVYAVKLIKASGTTPAVDKYTVKYYDGTELLGSESVNVGSKPTATGINTNKDFYAFEAWQLSGDDKALTDASWTSVAKDAVVTLTARYSGPTAYSSSATLISADVVSGKPNVNTIFAASNIVSSITFTSGNYEFTSNETKKGYYGYKDKQSGDYMKIMLQQGKRVQVLFGNLGADPTITVNGVAQALDAALASGNNVENTFTYNASSADALITITLGSGTNTLKSVTIEDIPALDDDATLSDLKIGGTTVAGFSASTHTYYYVLPYGTAIENIPAISATANSAKAKQVAIQQAVWTDAPYNCYRAQANVEAEDGSWGYYDVRFSFDKKQGVSLTKALASADNNSATSGYYGGTYSNGGHKGNTIKMEKNYTFGLILPEGKTFKDGDVFVMNITTAPGSATSMGTMKVYDAADATTPIYESDEVGTAGVNYWTLPAAAEGKSALYIKRGNGNDWNPTFSYVEVQRYMPSFIESFSIAGIGELEIDGNNITAEVANNFDVTSLTPTIKAWANGGATVTPTGVQNFTNPVVYTINSAYPTEDAAANYTVTITKVVPSATPSITAQPASANYYEGATIAALSVVATAEDGGNLTYQWYKGNDAIVGETEDTYTPDVTEIGSYSYKCEVTNKKGDKPAASVMSSVATIVIAEDPATIKLLNGSTVNTTDFITGVTATETVQFKGNTVNYAKFAGTCGSVTNVKDLTKVIAYNATTNKTRIQISAHNNSTSARSILVKGLVEGAEEAVDLATISLGNKEDKVSDWIEFNNAANRTIYIMVGSSAGDVYFTQVKVVESGETTLKKAGEAGYSLNFNKGRFFGVKDKTAVFEGMSVAVKSSDCAPLSTSIVKLVSSSMCFDVAAPVTLIVTTNNSNTYYVGTSTSATTNATAYKGASEFDLTAGTWYINAGSSNVEITNIAFIAPKCAKPTFEALANSDICAGDPYVALDGTGTVTDGGTITYKWYAEGGTDVLGTEATYTPAADGNYYVVALHHVDGFTDNSATSDVVTVTTYASAAITTAPVDQRIEAGEDATLSVVATGKAPLSYQWYTCDENGDNAEAIDGAESDSYVVAVTAGFSQYYKVIVSSGCGSASAVAKVEEWVELPQLDVTVTTTWDWTYAGENNKLVTGKNVEVVMANIKENGKLPTNDATFNSQALLFYGENVRATEGDRNYASVGHIKFNVTVPGRVTVEWSDNGGNSRRLKINDAMDESSTSKTDVRTFSAIVPAGEVTLMGVKSDGTSSNQYIRISKIIFTAEPDHERNVVIGNMGTVCLPNPSRAFGVKVYELAGKGEGCKVQFDELAENEVLAAGKAYVLVMTDTNPKFFYTSNEGVDGPDLTTAMKGNLEEDPIVFQPNTDEAQNVVFFKDNSMWSAATTGLKVGQYRAYLQYDEVGATTSAPAPGRRRISLDLQGQNAATGMDELNASDAPVKVLIDGQIYIIRGEKMFDTTGRLVK